MKTCYMLNIFGTMHDLDSKLEVHVAQTRTPGGSVQRWSWTSYTGALLSVAQSASVARQDRCTALRKRIGPVHDTIHSTYACRESDITYDDKEKGANGKLMQTQITFCDDTKCCCQWVKASDGDASNVAVFSYQSTERETSRHGGSESSNLEVRQTWLHWRQSFYSHYTLCTESGTRRRELLVAFCGSYCETVWETEPRWRRNREFARCCNENCRKERQNRHSNRFKYSETGVDSTGSLETYVSKNPQYPSGNLSLPRIPTNNLS